MSTVFVTGATGYIGRRMVAILLDRGHAVRALARPGSEHRLPAGSTPVIGDALRGVSYAGAIHPADTFVHLIGVAHPGPARAEQFLSVDLASVQQAVPAAVVSGIRHFVYLSVAHPAPVMRAYIAARTRGEEIVRDSGLGATMLRPWYVLGPDHRWPYLLLPAYWLLGALPPTRTGARRLGLVTLRQMVAALVHAVETPVAGVRIIEVPEIGRLVLTD